MLRRYNYTGRKRIKRSDVVVAVAAGVNGDARFDLILELGDLDLPDDGRVYVEAYHRREYVRFECGTVADLRLPMDRRLVGITFPERVHFRVKVIGSGSSAGQILALADRLIPDREAEEKRKPILPVKFEDEMGEAVWRLNMDIVSEPVLEVNKRIEGIESRVKHDPAFGALVWPSVVQEVLTQVLFTEGGYGAGADADWKQLWLQFVGRFYHQPPPEADSLPETQLKWRDEVVDAFCDRMQPRKRYEESGQ